MPRPAPTPDVSVRLAPIAPADETLVRLGGDASCALWWTHGLRWKDAPAGAIGQIEAASEDALVVLLSEACALLRGAGCAFALGPLDASMWSPHRLVTAPGAKHPFSLDVDTPAWWPFAFRAAGFSPVAYYVSTEHPVAEVPAPPPLVPGVTLRPLRTTPKELRRLHPLLEASLAARPGFVPLTPEVFAALVGPYKALVVDDFALVAEAADGALVGLVFAPPDADGRTLVVRALALDPAYAGLDALLLGTLAVHARARGLDRIVHALLPESDARPLCRLAPGTVRRRYALLAAPLR